MGRLTKSFLLISVFVPGFGCAENAVAQSSAAPTAYRINPGDEVEVFVWGEERLQRVVRVLPDGSFSFPLVGRVDARGRLPSEIESVITAGLRGQYAGQVPQVTVSIRNPAGLQFSVIGKVRTPGTFTPGRYVNALEALSFAGGPNEFAQLGNIVIVRKEGGTLRSIHVKLTDVMKGSPTAQDLSPQRVPELQGGDTVIVP